MRAALKKKMMVLLPAKFARSPGQNWRRNVDIGFSAIYAMNISAQSAMTREIFPQMMIFFEDFYSTFHSALNYSRKLSTFTESLLISIYWVQIFQFLSAYLFEIDQAQLKKSNYHILLFAWLVSMENFLDGNLLKRNFYFHLAFTCSNQSPQRKIRTKRMT